jgi:hypothetical protein
MLAFVIAAAVAANPAVDGAVITKVQGEIASACGASPPLSVSWDDFGNDEDGAKALAASELGFLSSAFATVCKDANLKGEVAKQISKVVLRQAYGATEPILYISKGTLFIEYLWVANEAAPDPGFVASEIADRLRGGEPEAP